MDTRSRERREMLLRGVCGPPFLQWSLDVGPGAHDGVVLEGLRLTAELRQDKFVRKATIGAMVADQVEAGRERQNGPVQPIRNLAAHGTPPAATGIGGRRNCASYPHKPRS